MQLEEEFNLSEKIRENLNLVVEDVKEFIKLLKKEINIWQRNINEYNKKHIFAEHLTDTSIFRLKDKIIDKLAGDKLI